MVDPRKVEAQFDQRCTICFASRATSLLEAIQTLSQSAQQILLSLLHFEEDVSNVEWLGGRWNKFSNDEGGTSRKPGCGSVIKRIGTVVRFTIGSRVDGNIGLIAVIKLCPTSTSPSISLVLSCDGLTTVFSSFPSARDGKNEGIGGERRRRLSHSPPVDTIPDRM